MKRFHLLSLLSAVLFICVSCVFISCGDDDKDDPITPVVDPSATLSLSTNSVTLASIPESNGQGRITVASNYKWTVTSDCNWLGTFIDRDHSDQFIIFSKFDNTSFEPRTGTISVSVGSLTQKVTVKQLGRKLVADCNGYSIKYNSNGIATSYVDDEDREFTGSNNGTKFTNTTKEDGITTTTTYELNVSDNRIVSAVVTIYDKDGKDYVNDVHNLTFEYNKADNLTKITDRWTEEEKTDGDVDTDSDTEVITFTYDVTDRGGENSQDLFGIIQKENHKWRSTKQSTITYGGVDRDPWNYQQTYLPCFVLTYPFGGQANAYVDLVPFAMMGLLGDFSIAVPVSYTNSQNSKKTDVPELEEDPITLYITKYGNKTIKYWPE